MITARVSRPSRVPFSTSRHARRRSDHGDDHEDQAILRIGLAEQIDRAGHRALDELDLAPEHERDELADDDAEAPGGEDRVERAGVERPHHEPLDDIAAHDSRSRTRTPSDHQGFQPSLVTSSAE